MNVFIFYALKTSKYSWFLAHRLKKGKLPKYIFGIIVEDNIKNPVYKLKFKEYNKMHILKFKPTKLENPRKDKYIIGKQEKQYIRFDYGKYDLADISWNGPLIDLELASKINLEQFELEERYETVF